MSIFTEDLFAKGVKQRVSTVGEDYVKKNLEAVSYTHLTLPTIE